MHLKRHSVMQMVRTSETAENQKQSHTKDETRLEVDEHL